MGRHMWAHGGDVVHVGSRTGHSGGSGRGGGGGDSGIMTIIVGIVLVVAIIWLIVWAFSSWANFITLIGVAWIAKKVMA